MFLELKASVLAAVHQEPTPDLQPDALGAAAALLLAQAQEVIAYKCIRGQYCPRPPSCGASARPRETSSSVSSFDFLGGV